MFLYELALELDRKSAELIEIGTGIGMVGLGPSVMLSPDQVAQLRAAAGSPAAMGAGPAPVGPAIWGPPSADGTAPAPAPLPTPDASPGPRRRSLIAVGVVAVIVVAALGAFVLGGRGGDAPLPEGDPDLIADLDTPSASGGSDGSEDPAPAALDPERIASALPDADRVIVGRTGFTFDPPGQETVMLATAGKDNIAGDCTPDVQPQGRTIRGHDLRDRSGGNHGGVAMTVRTFTTAEEAQAWLAAHRTAEYQACQRAKLRAEVQEISGGPVTSDAYVLEDGVAGGSHDRFSADYVAPGGHLCTAYRDVYFNVVGTVGLMTKFNTCHEPFDPAAMDELVEVAVSTLPAPASPES